MNRRNFLGCTSGAIATVGISPMMSPAESPVSQDDNINVVGPKEGYTPQIGTLVSMMNWMRDTVLISLRGMSPKDLDYLHDDDANTIGAMLWHLASTERFYQLNTFENRRWGDWPAEEDNKWGIGMALGPRARRVIKGHDLDFYLEKLATVREYSLQELAKRDDAWLLSVDEGWGWGPTNNYCKWFHVVEHESNHNGQIKWISSRIS